ncbi:MAG: dihydroorotase [Candidatus Omnitrophota bacterium]|nr:dihydroorotase [Candidatus Omnitrophota bacterium]
MSLLIKGGRVIDPANKVDKIVDIAIEKGRISQLGSDIKPEGLKLIDARGLIVTPGLIDMHTHLREPGREDEETILSGSRAASKGGFTSVCVMPNTEPAIDKEAVVEFILSKAQQAGVVNVYPIGAITRGRAGKILAEMGELKRAGVVGLSDDGNPVEDSRVMRRALEYSKMFNLPIISHCEDKQLSAGGVMNEGWVSTALGLRGIPCICEEHIVARDISLAVLTGGRLHIAHVSSAGSVKIIKQAKKDGVNVTAEATPHHFTLNDENLRSFSTNYKVNPPLRTDKDVDAVKQALADGVIDAIASDHAPHSEEEKSVEFDYAPFGIIGLETALGLAIRELIEKKILTLSQLIEKMSVNPARILGLNKGRLDIGAEGDVTIIDLKRDWVVKEKEFRSKSKNSPFIGERLKGMAVITICRGKVVYDAQ